MSRRDLTELSKTKQNKSPITLKKKSKVATIDNLKCTLSNKNHKTYKEMVKCGSGSVIEAEAVNRTD